MEKIEYDVLFRDSKNKPWELYAIYCDEKEMQTQFDSAKLNHSEVKVTQRVIKEQEQDVIVWRNGHYELNNLN